jgi:hypothetical protein
METTYGSESGIVHFWNEEDAAAAEQAMVSIDTSVIQQLRDNSHLDAALCGSRRS